MLRLHGALQHAVVPFTEKSPLPPHPTPFTSASISLNHFRASTPLPISFHSAALSPPRSLPRPGSLPSVCLCARGAVCYLDDLVREGQRDFISCLPEGLWYLWCYKAALLKKPTFGGGGAQWLSRLRFSLCIWLRVQVFLVGAHLWSPRHLQCLRWALSIFQCMMAVNVGTCGLRVAPYVLWVRVLWVGACLWASVGLYGASSLFYWKPAPRWEMSLRVTCTRCSGRKFELI